MNNSRQGRLTLCLYKHGLCCAIVLEHHFHDLFSFSLGAFGIGFWALLGVLSFILGFSSITSTNFISL